MRALALLVLAGTLAQSGFVPAHLLTGYPPPRQPPDVVRGGQPALEVTVNDDGTVGPVSTLRDSPPFTELRRAAVATWRFDPASEGDHRLRSRVLVAAVFRAPVLSAGPAPFFPRRDPSTPCGEVPYPIEIVEPPYPVTSLAEEVVLVEMDLEANGRVADSRLVEGKEPFAELALAAARRWRFEPACRQGRPVGAVAYVAFGFRPPVTAPRR
jgi:TonB family protein